jgi:hypothetical protein
MKAKPTGVPKKAYERELLRLQEELVKMAEWVKDSGSRVVVVFEPTPLSSRAECRIAGESTPPRYTWAR